MSDPELKNYLTEKINDNPQSLVFARLADICLQEDQVDEAIHLCQEGLKGNPAYVTGHYVLAKAFIQKNNLEKAESVLKKVLSLDRYYISALKCLGDIMIKLGWDNTAATHFKDALQIDPLEKSVQIALEHIAEDISEMVELPPSDVIEESDMAEEDNATEKSDKQEEEWVNQIREVFPDELSEQTDQQQTQKTTDIQEPATDTPIQEEISAKEKPTVTDEQNNTLKNETTDLSAESEITTEKTESSENTEGFSDVQLDDFNITEASEEETPSGEITSEISVIESDEKFEEWDLETLSVEDNIEKLPDADTSIDESEDIADEEEIILEEEDLLEIDPSEEASLPEDHGKIDQNQVGQESDQASLDDWNIESIEKPGEETPEASTESIPTDAPSESGNHSQTDTDYVPENTHEEKFIDMIEEFDSVSEDTENETVEDLKLDIDISESDEKSLQPVNESGDQQSSEPSSESEETETIETPTLPADEPAVPDNKSPESVKEKKTKKESSEDKAESTAPAEKNLPEQTGASKILTPTLGEIYIAQGQYEKALNIFKQLSEMHPKEVKYQEKIKSLEEKIKDMDL